MKKALFSLLILTGCITIKPEIKCPLTTTRRAFQGLHKPILEYNMDYPFGTIDSFQSKGYLFLDTQAIYPYSNLLYIRPEEEDTLVSNYDFYNNLDRVNIDSLLREFRFRMFKEAGKDTLESWFYDDSLIIKNGDSIKYIPKVEHNLIWL
jgi:hypothetical protein